MLEIVHRDARQLVAAEPDIGRLVDTSFLITGATGSIGSYAVMVILELARLTGSNCHITAHARDLTKAARQFTALREDPRLTLVTGPLSDLRPPSGLGVVLHTASPTRPEDFSHRPVDIITANVIDTQRLIETAHHVQAQFCLLSSLEIYGQITAPDYPVLVSESDFGALDSTSLRSVYPESKRMAESLVVAHRAQSGLDGTIVRLGPTVSPVVDPSDQRIFAQLVRDTALGRDLQIFSDAAAKQRSYTYVGDTVTGILTALGRARPTEDAPTDDFVFNLANNDNAVSIGDLAERIVALGQAGTRLTVAQRAADPNTSTTTGLVLLDSQRLLALGWRPSFTLDQCIQVALESVRSHSQQLP